MQNQIKMADHKWLNKGFLESMVKSWRLNNSIEILKFDVSSNFSEHFASTMFQCKIVFKSSKHSQSDPEILDVVIKTMPVNEEMKMRVVGRGPLFETEIQMYKETIPAMHQLFEKSGIKVTLGPK